ncbi:hypothetical protein HFK86_26015 [Ralstonia pseudosolanacearum]|uniref:Uncharacterized protein n=1 Tax=Ralstonia pseudosolanacearum TaxID=1310165 RepID=A0A454THZ6_9RALS|nr:hypothetical protein CJO89_12885 [Ralstonia solanacearum]MCK4135748.1 hypothetical protein [Ralstonia pseudosolanacearum]MCK4150486.1 hypothetical protein [Ralstonia pseudosolanacearum]QOK86367.1 hypothetical protein HF907_06835 [Ralstonia pseudosolanacearum]RAA04374.1 hypothetical protein DOT67_26505 [Ralstonia pseudosolanacearum]
MKSARIKKAIVILLCAAATVVFARGSGSSAGGRSHSSHTPGGYYGYSGEHYTNGYTRRDGTHVDGHFQTNPNSTQRDNWSAKGNVNPHTGKEGTKEPTH